MPLDGSARTLALSYWPGVLRPSSAVKRARSQQAQGRVEPFRFEEIGLVDLLQVLEGAAYVGFIAGAIFAVIEIRAIAKDRRLEFWMRVTEASSTREFTEATCKLWRAKGTTAEELESEVSYVDLSMIADRLEMIASLGVKGLISRKELVAYIPFETYWKKLRPWVLAERAVYGLPELCDDIEALAGEQSAMGA